MLIEIKRFSVYGRGMCWCTIFVYSSSPKMVCRPTEYYVRWLRECQHFTQPVTILVCLHMRFSQMVKKQTTWCANIFARFFCGGIASKRSNIVQSTERKRYSKIIRNANWKDKPYPISFLPAADTIHIKEWKKRIFKNGIDFKRLASFTCQTFFCPFFLVTRKRKYMTT